jgi:hypothetical protein
MRQSTPRRRYFAREGLFQSIDGLDHQASLGDSSFPIQQLRQGPPKFPLVLIVSEEQFFAFEDIYSLDERKINTESVMRYKPQWLVRDA